jgi:hypothetical protein
MSATHRVPSAARVVPLHRDGWMDGFDKLELLISAPA